MHINSHHKNGEISNMKLQINGSDEIRPDLNGSINHRAIQVIHGTGGSIASRQARNGSGWSNRRE